MGPNNDPGLTHLALPYYERVLELAEAMAQQAAADIDGSSNARPNVQDFAKEAAYNLQNIYFMSGNMTMATQITERYLVV